MKKHTLFLVALKILGNLPLSVGRILGSILGRLSWLVQDRGCRTTQTNLALCFPELNEEERRALAKASMVETGKLAFEICQIWHRDRAWFDSKIVKVTGVELLESSIEAGKGVIVLGPHLGNWEFLGLWLSRFGDRCTYLYQPPKLRAIEPLMKAAREKFGANTVPTNRRGVAEVLKLLKKGGVTGILPDQVPEENGGEFSTFFGQSAYTMSLIHGLIQRTGCSVVYGVALREAKGFHLLLKEVPKEIYSENLLDSLRALNSGIEELVSAYMEQYQWEYKRFKKTVSGEDPY